MVVIAVFKSFLVTDFFRENDSLYVKIACLGLLAFFLSFILPVSSKFTNNIFYIFVGLPLVGELTVNFRKKFFVVGKVFPYVAAFLLYMIVRVLLAKDFSDLRVFLYVGFFFVFTSTLVSRSYVNEEVVAIVAMIALFFHACLLAILYYTVDGHDFSSRVIYEDSWRLGNPIYICMLLSMFSVVVAAVLVRNERYLLALTPLLAALIIMVVYKTRSGILGYFGCSVALFLAVCYYRKTSVLIFFSLAVLLLAGAYTLGVFDVLISRGASYRGEIYRLVYSEYLNCSTLWGCGYSYELQSMFGGGKFKLNHPHSIYMSQLIFAGVAGLLLILALLFKAMIVGWKFNTAWLWAVICSATFLLVDGSNVYDSPGPMWILFWLPLAVIDGVSSRSKYQDE